MQNEPAEVLYLFSHPGQKLGQGKDVVMLSKETKFRQNIAMPSKGIFSRYHIQPGDTVNKGDKLFSFKSVDHPSL
jgi:biotin carboxyl carrier protein